MIVVALRCVCVRQSLSQSVLLMVDRCRKSAGISYSSSSSSIEVYIIIIRLDSTSNKSSTVLSER